MNTDTYEKATGILSILNDLKNHREKILSEGTPYPGDSFIWNNPRQFYNYSIMLPFEMIQKHTKEIVAYLDDLIAELEQELEQL